MVSRLEEGGLAFSLGDLDAECVLVKLRGRCLRILNRRGGKSYEGLAAAARACRAAKCITPNLAKKLVQLDESCNWLRHASVERADEFTRLLTSELAACGHAPVNEADDSSSAVDSTGDSNRAGQEWQQSMGTSFNATISAGGKGQEWQQSMGTSLNAAISACGQGQECGAQTELTLPPHSTAYYGYTMPVSTASVGDGADVSGHSLRPLHLLEAEWHQRRTAISYSAAINAINASGEGQ